MKKMMSVLMVLLISLQFMFLSMNTFVLADTLTSPIEDPGAYKPQDLSPNNFDETLKAAGSVLGAIRNIGIIVSVISVMIVGIKYMLGSVEEKAEYKATMIPIVIGIVMLSSIITIIDIIYTATTNVFG